MWSNDPKPAKSVSINQSIDLGHTKKCEKNAPKWTKIEMWRNAPKQALPGSINQSIDPGHTKKCEEMLPSRRYKECEVQSRPYHEMRSKAPKHNIQ